MVDLHGGGGGGGWFKNKQLVIISNIQYLFSDGISIRTVGAGGAGPEKGGSGATVELVKDGSNSEFCPTSTFTRTNNIQTGGGGGGPTHWYRWF